MTGSSPACPQCNDYEFSDPVYLKKDFTCARCPDGCDGCDNFTGLCKACYEGERVHASDAAGGPAPQRTLRPTCCVGAQLERSFGAPGDTSPTLNPLPPCARLLPVEALR